jgi:hypothetical protein
MTEEKNFLPLGSIVILQGTLKKVMIIARGATTETEYFDYGAVLYPEGMLDANVAYFRPGNILKVVHEGYRDEDDVLLSEQLAEAKNEFLESLAQNKENAQIQETITTELADVEDDDPFASVRDLEDDE